MIARKKEDKEGADDCDGDCDGDYDCDSNAKWQGLVMMIMIMITVTMMMIMMMMMPAKYLCLPFHLTLHCHMKITIRGAVTIITRICT
jgi:hypothetical protein